MYQNTCTICFQEQDNLKPLLTNQTNSSLFDNLQNKLKIVFTNLEQWIICSKCHTELKGTIIFLEKCEKANDVLITLSRCSSDDVSAVHYDFTNEENTQVEKRIDIQNDKNQKMQTILEDLSTPCTNCGALHRCKHRVPPTAHICPYCQKVFNRKFNFTIHIKRHLGQREWRCVECGAAALSRWLARTHCRPRTRRACPVDSCARTFTSAANLATHLRKHTGERPHLCSECSKSFTSRDTLRNHLRTHTGAKPYLCAECGAQFATNKLAAHRRAHARARMRLPTRNCGNSGPGGKAASARAHVCPWCATRYAHKQSLNKHVRNKHLQNVAASAD